MNPPLYIHIIWYSEPGSRFGIAMEVYYSRCLIEGHPCLLAYDYRSNNNIVSQRLVEKF